MAVFASNSRIQLSLEIFPNIRFLYALDEAEELGCSASYPDRHVNI